MNHNDGSKNQVSLLIPLPSTVDLGTGLRLMLVACFASLAFSPGGLRAVVPRHHRSSRCGAAVALDAAPEPSADPEQAVPLDEQWAAECVEKCRLAGHPDRLERATLASVKRPDPAWRCTHATPRPRPHELGLSSAPPAVRALLGARYDRREQRLRYHAGPRPGADARGRSGARAKARGRAGPMSRSVASELRRCAHEVLDTQHQSLTGHTQSTPRAGEALRISSLYPHASIVPTDGGQEPSRPEPGKAHFTRWRIFCQRVHPSSFSPG